MLRLHGVTGSHKASTEAADHTYNHDHVQTITGSCSSNFPRPGDQTGSRRVEADSASHWRACFQGSIGHRPDTMLPRELGLDAWSKGVATAEREVPLQVRQQVSQGREQRVRGTGGIWQSNIRQREPGHKAAPLGLLHVWDGS